MWEGNSLDFRTMHEFIIWTTGPRPLWKDGWRHKAQVLGKMQWSAGVWSLFRHLKMELGTSPVREGSMWYIFCLNFPLESHFSGVHPCAGVLLSPYCAIYNVLPIRVLWGFFTLKIFQDAYRWWIWGCLCDIWGRSLTMTVLAKAQSPTYFFFVRFVSWNAKTLVWEWNSTPNWNLIVGFIRQKSLTLNGSSALIFSPRGRSLAGLSLLCLWDAFAFGIVREHVDIKPMESAASEWGY